MNFSKVMRSVLALMMATLLLLPVGCGQQTSVEQQLGDENTEAPSPSPTPIANINISQTLVGFIVDNSEGLLSRLAQHGFLRTAENLGYPARLYDAATSEEAAARVEEAIADGCRGILVWANSDAMKQAIQRAKDAGLVVVVPYFPLDGEAQDANLAPDPMDYAPEAARILCARLEERKVETGLIVIDGADQEPVVADAFEAKIKSDYPQYRVERFTQPITQENLEAFVLANADLAGVLALDNQSGKMWSNACNDVQAQLKQQAQSANSESESASPEASPTPVPDNLKRAATIIVLDYTEAHLAWVRDGRVFGVIARPYYDSTAKGMAVLDRLMRGLPTQTDVRLDAPVIRQKNVSKYVAIALEVKEWFGLE